MTWTKLDGFEIGTMQSQKVTNYEESTYENEIRVSGLIIAGRYRARITNSLSGITSSMYLQGKN